MTVSASAQWYRAGNLQLQSQAVSPLAEDLGRLEHWLDVDLWLDAFTVPTQLGKVQSVAWRSKEILNITDEFRKCALPGKGAEWGDSLPLAPLTKTEVSELLRAQQQQDAHVALRQTQC